MKSVKPPISKLVNRETVLYGIFGIITSVMNVLLFRCFIIYGLDYRYANLYTLLCVKLTAYVCNKNIVFQSKTGSPLGLLREFLRFVVSRGLTMLIDYFVLIFMVEVLALDKLVSKCFVTALVVIINYFTGKKHVFIKR